MQSVKYDTFYRYDEMCSFLFKAKSEYPDLMKLHELVITKEGRTVFVVEVTDTSTGPAGQKAAYYLQAGLHAIEGAGTTAALHVLYSLLSEEKYKALLKNIAFYIVPCFDPDGLELALTAHADIRNRIILTGSTNELIPRDINGDGYILQMRWKDAAGPYKVDYQEPRMMVKRDVGDKEGLFYHVAQEGIIENYDGTPYIRSAAQIDFNRGYPVDWNVNVSNSAYPFAEPELRAVADFMLARPNIFAGVDLHCGTHAILRPSWKPDHELPPEDVDIIHGVGKLAEQITGFPLLTDEKYGWDRTNKISGNSNDWAYAKLGISHYIVEVGFGYTSLGLSTDEILGADEASRVDFMRRLFALHDANNSQIFVPWQKCVHPQLGEVEVGGLMVGNARFMHPPDMEKTVSRTTEFIYRHASMHPIITIENVETEALGNRLFRIRATVANIGGFSTEVMKAGSAHFKKNVRVKIAGENVAVLNQSNLQETPVLRALGGSFAVEWFVRTNGTTSEIVIEASHPRTGIARRQVILKPSF